MYATEKNGAKREKTGKARDPEGGPFHAADRNTASFVLLEIAARRAQRQEWLLN
jgi:hypothetical protein